MPISNVRAHDRIGTKGVRSHTRELEDNRVPHNNKNDITIRERDLGMGEKKLSIYDKSSGKELGFIHYILTEDRETMFGDIKKGNIHVSYMEVYKEERGKGYSRIMLKELSKIADKKKFNIHLSARTSKLSNYYKQYGFTEIETIDKSVIMIRKYD